MIRITPHTVSVTVAPFGYRGPYYKAENLPADVARDMVNDLKYAMLNLCENHGGLTKVYPKTHQHD